MNIKTNKCQSSHYVYFTITMIHKGNNYNYHQELENYINSQSPLRITSYNDPFIPTVSKLLYLSIKIMLISRLITSRDAFRTLLIISDGAFYKNSERLLAITIIAKSYISDVWQTLKCDSGEWIRGKQKQPSKEFL